MELLSKILNDGEIVRKPFAPSTTYETDRLMRWEKLRDELMFGNRFFPYAEMDRERLTNLLSYLISIQMSFLRSGIVPVCCSKGNLT